MSKNELNLNEVIFAGLDRSHIQVVEKICERLQSAVGLVTRLRGPNGCPWDREQSHLSLRQYLIEEAYEVLDVLDRYQPTQDSKEIAKQTSKSDWVPADGKMPKDLQRDLCEELGDLLLQVLLHSQLAAERGEFDFGDVAENMARKLVGRHPHVFGDVQVSGSDQVLQNWEALKKKEGKKKLLEGLPKNLPSLQRAARIGEKTHRVGFDWKDWHGAWTKVEEEMNELKQAIAGGNTKEIEHEIGDLFFSLCNLSRHLKIQPEDAHRKAITRFEGRFSMLEQICENEGIDIQSASLEKLDEVWDRVKKAQN